MKVRKSFLHPVFLVVIIGAIFFLTGCPNPQQEQSLTQIQSQISVLSNEVRDSFKRSEDERISLYKKLNDDVRQLQKNQADTSVTNDQLTTALVAIDAKLDEYNTRMTKLSERLETAETALTDRMTLLSEQVSEIGRETTISPVTPGLRSSPATPIPQPGESPVPQASPPLDPEASQLYHTAYTAYVNGNFDSAIAEFKKYMELYPDTELSDIAQFWIAESFFSIGEYETALREYDKLISLYPDSDKVPAAFLSKADTYLKLDRQIEAISHLKYVVNRYPGSTYAQKAAERLSSLGE